MASKRRGIVELTKILASASYDDTIRLWKDEDDDWYSFQTLTAHSSTVWCVDFNQDGTMLGIIII